MLTGGASQGDQGVRRLVQHPQGARNVVAFAAGHISHAVCLGAIDRAHLIDKECGIQNRVKRDTKDHRDYPSE